MIEFSFDNLKTWAANRGIDEWCTTEADSLGTAEAEALYDTVLRAAYRRVNNLAEADALDWPALIAECAEPANEPACECGQVIGVRCEWRGPLQDAVTVEYVPEHLQAQCEAAGGVGEYPHGDSQRIRCAPECADWLVESDPDWFWIVESST